MPAAKSGNHIYITGSPNTLASITVDIGDIAFIEKTGVAPDIYTVKGNVARYLRVRNGGVLTIGDPADYSMNETLEFENLANDRTRFYVDTGGTLFQYGDTTLNISKGPSRPSYSYLYGKIDVLGNDTFKPVWKNFRRLYCYENQNNNTYVNDVWHFEKMIVGSGFTANDYAFMFYSFGKVRNHIWKDITCDQSYGNNVNTRYFYLPYGYRGFENVTFENINFADFGYAIMNYGVPIKAKNCTFGDSATWKLYEYRRVAVDPSKTYRGYGYGSVPFLGQQFRFFEGCTFENKNNKNIAHIEVANVVFKDCEWQHNAGDSIECRYQGRVYMWTGNTFTGGREVYDVDYDGAIQWVHAFEPTIQDCAGNPIEGVIIHARQKDGKEEFVARTKANGKIEALFDIECLLLTNKHQYGNNKVTNAEYWSDASNGTYHDIWLYKKGYAAQRLERVMSSDQVEIITMKLQQTGLFSGLSMTG